jgi:hypothetical protein
LTSSFQPYYGPGVDLASKRNENQESSWRKRAAGSSLPAMGQLSRKCGSLDVSQTYGPARSVSKIVSSNNLLRTIRRDYNGCIVEQLAVSLFLSVSKKVFMKKKLSLET